VIPPPEGICSPSGSPARTGTRRREHVQRVVSPGEPYPESRDAARHKQNDRRAAPTELRSRGDGASSAQAQDGADGGGDGHPGRGGAACSAALGGLQLRDWATSVGPWFPLAFLATHIVVTYCVSTHCVHAGRRGTAWRRFRGGFRVTLAVAASAASAVIALAWSGRRLGAEPPGPSSRCREARRPAARPRLGCGHVTTADPRGCRSRC